MMQRETGDKVDKFSECDCSDIPSNQSWVPVLENIERGEKRK